MNTLAGAIVKLNSRQSWTIISRIFAKKVLNSFRQPLLVWAINWVEISVKIVKRISC